MRRLSLLIIFTLTVLCSYGQDTYKALLKASVLRSQSRPGEAITVLSEALLTARSSDLLCERGEAYLSAGMVKKASSDFMAAEALVPGKGLYGLSRCAAVSNDAKGTVGYLEALMKSAYKKSESEISLDTTFAPVTSSTEWREFWKKEWYKGFEKSKGAIEYYLKAGRTDLAREEYASLASLYPDTETEDYCEALIDIATGDLAVAISCLSRLTTEGGNINPSYIKTLARAHDAAGNYFASAAEYGKLIKAEYNDVSLFLLRGTELKKAGDRDGAVRDMETYLSFYPDDYRALSLIGKTLAENGSLYEALPYMNKNIETNPAKAAAYSERGDVYFMCRSWENAIADYSMSLDINPSDGAVYLNMGVAMINSGDSAGACSFLRKALKMGQKEAVKYISRYCNN